MNTKEVYEEHKETIEKIASNAVDELFNVFLVDEEVSQLTTMQIVELSEDVLAIKFEELKSKEPSKQHD